MDGDQADCRFASLMDTFLYLAHLYTFHRDSSHIGTRTEPNTWNEHETREGFPN